MRPPDPLAAPSTTTVESHPDGDDVRIAVRLVVAPSAGRFHPAPPDSATAAGAQIDPGALIGHVVQAGGREAVRSFCRGILVAVLADHDDQVRAGQPVAWIRPVGP